VPERLLRNSLPLTPRICSFLLTAFLEDLTDRPLTPQICSTLLTAFLEGLTELHHFHSLMTSSEQLTATGEHLKILKRGMYISLLQALPHACGREPGVRVFIWLAMLSSNQPTEIILTASLTTWLPTQLRQPAPLFVLIPITSMLSVKPTHRLVLSHRLLLLRLMRHGDKSMAGS
jgi:hypothetical protein